MIPTFAGLNNGFSSTNLGPTIAGVAAVGNALFSYGYYGYIISGLPFPGETLTSTPNGKWYINDVDTGESGRIFIVPNTVSAGDAIRRGNSNILYAEVQGIYSLYGLRNIYSGYSGPLVRLRRSSDSVEADFSGVAASGWVDNTAVSGWLGGSSGLVTKLYDLTSRGRDWIQTDPNAQPPWAADGSESYVSFLPNKCLNLGADGLNFLRYVPGGTLAMRMRAPTSPGAVRSPITFTVADSTVTGRMGITLTSQRNARLNTATLGDTSVVQTTLTALGTDWFSAVVQSNYRNATSRANFDGNVSTAALTEAARTLNTPSALARLNGTSADTGMTYQLKALAMYQRALPDAEADALKTSFDSLNTLSMYPKGVVQDYGDIRSRVFWYGDSMTEQVQVTDPALRSTSLCSDFWPKYRLFTNRGRSGETSTQIKGRFLLQPIANDEVVIFWGGRNNVNVTGVMADVAEVYAAMPPSKKLVIVSICNSTAETTGNPNYANLKIINDMISGLYPNNYVDLRNAWINSYDPTNSGDVLNYSRNQPPGSQMADGLHPNASGASTIAGVIGNFILSKNW